MTDNGQSSKLPVADAVDTLDFLETLNAPQEYVDFRDILHLLPPVRLADAPGSSASTVSGSRSRNCESVLLQSSSDFDGGFSQYPGPGGHLDDEDDNFFETEHLDHEPRQQMEPVADTLPPDQWVTPDHSYLPPLPAFEELLRIHHAAPTEGLSDALSTLNIAELALSDSTAQTESLTHASNTASSREVAQERELISEISKLEPELTNSTGDVGKTESCRPHHECESNDNFKESFRDTQAGMSGKGPEGADNDSLIAQDAGSDDDSKSDDTCELLRSPSLPNVPTPECVVALKPSLIPSPARKRLEVRNLQPMFAPRRAENCSNPILSEGSTQVANDARSERVGHGTDRPHTNEGPGASVPLDSLTTRGSKTANMTDHDFERFIRENNKRLQKARIESARSRDVPRNAGTRSAQSAARQPEGGNQSVARPAKQTGRKSTTNRIGGNPAPKQTGEDLAALLSGHNQRTTEQRLKRMHQRRARTATLGISRDGCLYENDAAAGNGVERGVPDAQLSHHAEAHVEYTPAADAGRIRESELGRERSRSTATSYGAEGSDHYSSEPAALSGAPKPGHGTTQVSAGGTKPSGGRTDSSTYRTRPVSARLRQSESEKRERREEQNLAAILSKHNDLVRSRRRGPTEVGSRIE